MERKTSAFSGIPDIPALFGYSGSNLLTVPNTAAPTYPAGDQGGAGLQSAGQSRRSSFGGRGSPRWSIGRKGKKSFQAKQKERQDWLKKYTPLSSTDLTNVNGSKSLNNTSAATSNETSTNHNSSTSTTGNGNSKISTDAGPYIIDPNSERTYIWLTIVSVCVVYYLWIVILRMTVFLNPYHSEQQQEGHATNNSILNTLMTILVVLIDVFSNIIYAFDVYMQLHTAYLQNGILEIKPHRIARRYKSGWKSYCDIVSILPVDILYDLGLHNQPVFLVVKLLKVYRLQEFQNMLENRTHFPNACRFAFLLHNILLIIHWNGCVYYYISKIIGFGTDQWVYPAMPSSSIESDSSHSRTVLYTSSSAMSSSIHTYVYCFYWSTLTLTTIGGHPEPVNIAEYLFMTVDYLVGILMFATLVGNIGGIIEKMRKDRAKFQGKLDRVKSYMKAMDVPSSLQGRVIKWFDYLWSHGHPVDNNTALNSLPDKLKAEIAIHVHFETLKKVDFFDHCDQSFLWELVLKLQIQVYSPGDYVCRKGDVGREMYIVSHGKLEVVADEDGEVLRVLNHGDYFGEISVLNLGGSHRRRTAFVRSVGYSDLLCLSQNDLFDVLYDYPQAMELLQNKGIEKLASSKISIDESTSEIFGTEYSDIPEDVSDINSDDTPATTADVKQVSEQLLDLQVKMYEVEDMLKNLVLETRQKEILSKTVRFNETRRYSSFSSLDDDNLSTSNLDKDVEFKLVVSSPAETGSGIQHRRSSSVQ